MPVTLKLLFPAGRYHATPWGRHVNEGVPEWPPSPWRLLRALVAVWKRTCPDLPEDRVRRVLVALAAEPPLFRLPPHRVAHTRHYMPWEKKRPDDRTLVFDTFVVVGRCAPLFVHWPDAALPTDDELCLRRLVGNLTTLGRAEGWVEACVESFPASPEPGEPNCVPSPDGDTLPVFCPDPDTAFGGEHYPPPPDAKALRKGLKPDDYLFDAPRWHLCLDTQTIHAEKWPRVPGAKWVAYTRPPDAPAPARPKPPERSGPTVARFLLDGPVLPLVTDTLRVAEAFRGAVMSQFGRWCLTHEAESEKFRRTNDPKKFSSPVLSGKDAGGAMADAHDHAHYLPTADAADPRRVGTVTVYAPGGFGPGEVAALTAVRTVRLGEGDPLRVQLVGLGENELFRGGLFGPARVWRSVTPAVGPEHIGRHGRDRYLLKAVRRDARRWADRHKDIEGNKAVLEDVRRDEERATTLPPARLFRRSRSRDGSDGYRRPCDFFVLTFAAAVAGPVCLGYAGHFGLGLFAPFEPPAAASALAE